MKLRVAPGAPSLSPHRADLQAVNAEIGDLRQQIKQLSAANPRLTAVLDAETAAIGAVEAVATAEAADVERFIAQGGAGPRPRAAERAAALDARESATRAADVARRLEADRQAQLAGLTRDLAAAIDKRQAAITAIVTEEAVPDALRRYTAAVVAVNAGWSGVLAVIDALEERGNPSAVTHNASALPRVIMCPTLDVALPEGPVTVESAAMIREARDRLAAFVEALADDPAAELPGRA